MGSTRARSAAIRAERQPWSGVAAKRQKSVAAIASTDTEYAMERSCRKAAEERNVILSSCTGAGRANGGKQNATH